MIFMIFSIFTVAVRTLNHWKINCAFVAGVTAHAFCRQKTSYHMEVLLVKVSYTQTACWCGKLEKSPRQTCAGGDYKKGWWDDIAWREVQHLAMSNCENLSNCGNQQHSRGLHVSMLRIQVMAIGLQLTMTNEALALTMLPLRRCGLSSCASCENCAA